VARLGEKALPFYALMKKSNDKFEWTEEADTAFAQLKKVLSTPAVLVAPNEKEPLLLYIATTHQVVSTVLVVERSEEGKTHGVQRPVYFLNEVVVTQHTTSCCSIQVVDITLVKYQFTNITSLRVVQQKHSGLYSSTEYYKP
jgi:hypothetical protein